MFNRITKYIPKRPVVVISKLKPGLSRFCGFAKQSFMQKPWFYLVFVVPIIIAFLYLCLMKTPGYESDAKIVLRQNKAEVAGSEFSIGSLLSGVEQTTKDDYLLMGYLDSSEMLQRLNADMGLLNHYQSNQLDWFSRLGSSSNSHKRLDYFQSHLTITYDDTSSSIELAVRDRDPQYAQKLLNDLLNQSSLFANKITHAMAYKRLEFSGAEAEKAKEKLRKQETVMLGFQNKHHIIDPEKSIEQTAGIMGNLQSTLVGKETALINLESFMQESSPRIVSLKDEIIALKDQIKSQNGQLLGVNGSDKLNSVMAQYAWLKMDTEFAMTEYKADVAAKEMAKMDIAKDQNALIMIQSPSLPDYAKYPEVIYDMITILFGLLILYSLTKMTWTIIQEHRD